MATATYDPNDLLAGDFPAAIDTVTILSGQNLKRGAVIGAVTASGKYILSLSAASDGSEGAKAVLGADCDATGGDKKAPAFFTGEFNKDKLTFGTGHTAATVNAGMRASGQALFIRTLA